MTHRFLHLSDIHFGQEGHGTLPKHEAVRSGLLRDAKELARQRGPVTRILVTGDIAYSGKPEQYEIAAEWLDGLAGACGCQETHVCTIAGNHDCDRGAISAQAKMIYANLRASTPEQLQANLHAICGDGEGSSPFLPKLQAYRQFANAYGCDFESASKPAWAQYYDLPGGYRLKLLGLTSVQVSNDEDSPGKMVLGNQQYVIGEEDGVINVVMLHHPLEWFMDKLEAAQNFQNHARVMMVGHEHSLGIQKTVDGFTKREWLTVYAGAVNPPEKEFSFTYNWIEIGCGQINGITHLLVDVFPRVWVQERMSFEADRNRLGENGDSVRVEISCPNLRPTAEAERSAGVTVSAQPQCPDGGASVRSDAEKPASEVAHAEEGGKTMVNKNGYDRLRFLFWRYLDWRERLKVLVDVDALPRTADQPLPQTLERVALESAAKDGAKLRKLWDAVMPLIPEGKRGSNPF